MIPPVDGREAAGVIGCEREGGGMLGTLRLARRAGVADCARAEWLATTGMLCWLAVASFDLSRPPTFTASSCAA